MSEQRKRILRDLKGIDGKILDLILKRCELFRRYVKKKISIGESISDSGLEKDLWLTWSKFAKRGLDEKFLRRVFNYLNWMGYELKQETSWEFMLNPPKIPVDICISGPRDCISSRFWTVVYAGAKRPFEMKSVVLNDPMHDLLKALSLANGDFSWTKDRILFEAKRDLNFESRPIFVGDDELNLYLLVFLSIATGGRFKFTGGNKLKILNLDPLFHVLSQLGARGVTLVPYADGLPIRIEASAVFTDTVVLPKELMNIKLISSLILCSIFYKTPSGYIKIVFPSDFEDKRYIQRVLDIFKRIGIQFEKNNKEVTVYNSQYELSSSLPEIFLDPVLSGFILAFPQAVGGKSVLRGKFPLELEEGKDVLDILLSSDLKINVFEDRIESIKGSKKPSYFIKSHGENTIPLALGVACLCEPEVIVEIEGDRKKEIELLEKLEFRYDLRENLLYLYNENKSFPKINISVPDPIWNMSLALVSFKRPYICITEPGEITAIWPQFWNIYKNFSKCRTWDMEEEDSGRTQKRRRIILD